MYTRTPLNTAINLLFASLVLAVSILLPPHPTPPSTHPPPTPDPDLGVDAPAYEFQSRTLFGSVYGAEIAGKMGGPAPTTYTVDDYSHARARWRATEEGKRVIARLELLEQQREVSAVPAHLGGGGRIALLCPCVRLCVAMLRGARA